MESKVYPVKIHIKSKIANLLGEDEPRPVVVEDDDGELTVVGTAVNTNSEKSSSLNDYSDIIETVTDGSIRVERDAFTVSYKEHEKMGFSNSTTSLSFNPSSPNVITMIRTGDASSAMLFDPSANRQICSYDTGIMPIELAVNTKNVRNSLTESGGSIFLEYTVEMRGIKTQHTQMEFKVKRTENRNEEERL